MLCGSGWGLFCWEVKLLMLRVVDFVFIFIFFFSFLEDGNEIVKFKF